VAESKTATKGTRRSAKRTTLTSKKYEGFTAEEQAAMKERAKELKAEAHADRDRAAGESDVLAKIAEMPEPDRAMAERLHAIIKASAPDLSPKTWYGMPAYAKEGKVVCFFQSAAKFNARYATFGFQEAANLDEGTVWPTSWALTELTAADEKRIAALVKRAVS
jgi:uncharacterized protein YdhG (YjbR/CyaY superfamily)